MSKHFPLLQSTLLAALITPALITVLIAAALGIAQAQTAASSAEPEAILRAADAEKLLPDAVFFRGQSATTQVRNSGGIRFDDGFYVLVTLVDTSGYSTGVQAKYQAYFLTEVALSINGKTLPPGAYGVGFIAGNKFIVQDIGAHELFTVDSVRDADLKRPTPLQILAAPEAHHYRLYAGRSYVTISRAE
jgi:hypothetical protein